MAATWDVSTREPTRPGTASGAQARRRLVVRSRGSWLDPGRGGRRRRRRRGTIEPWRRRVRTRLELRVLIAGILAATVIRGAVMCAAYGQASIAAALSIYALGVGAWLYHSVERLVLARRIETVRAAATPLRPLLPVMAAIMRLTQVVVRSLTDV